MSEQPPDRRRRKTLGQGVNPPREIADGVMPEDWESEPITDEHRLADPAYAYARSKHRIYQSERTAERRMKRMEKTLAAVGGLFLAVTGLVGAFKGKEQAQPPAEVQRLGKSVDDHERRLVSVEDHAEKTDNKLSRIDDRTDKTLGILVRMASKMGLPGLRAAGWRSSDDKKGAEQ